MLTTVILRYALFIFVIVYCGDLVVSLEDGDPCPFDDGSQGICTFLTSCPSALSLLQSGIFPTNTCGFLGTQPIVCCKSDETTTTTTTTTSAPALITRTTTSTEKPDYGNADRTPGEISRKKCIEYGKYVVDRSHAPTLSILPQILNTPECGFDHLKLIVGGTLATKIEFPHMALIGYKTGQEVNWACGGTLISENFVLTAAHCLRSHQLGPAALVRVGLTNQSDVINMQERRVGEIIAYPKYHDKYHDIGLLKLSENFNLNIYARPACLQTEKKISKAKAIASGWGKIHFSGEGSNDLLKVVLEFFNVDKCNHTYRKDIAAPDSNLREGIIDEWMICAGSSTELKDTCQGDSGGPLQIYHDESEVKCMYDVVGVTSFGKSCGLAKNLPGVYTRVSNYIKWIEDIVWPY